MCQMSRDKDDEEKAALAAAEGDKAGKSKKKGFGQEAAEQERAGGSR
jgi:hypothetical protein